MSIMMRCTVFLVLPMLAFGMHKYYVSNTLIEHNVRTQALEIVIRTFTDDFEIALGGTEKNPLRLGDAREVHNANELIEEYIAAHFKVEIDDEHPRMNFIGKETDGEQVVCYIEIPFVADFRTVTVTNTMLMEKFSGQKNVIDLHAGRWSKTEILSEEKMSATFFK